MFLKLNKTVISVREIEKGSWVILAEGALVRVHASNKQKGKPHTYREVTAYDEHGKQGPSGMVHVADFLIAQKTPTTGFYPVGHRSLGMLHMSRKACE